MLRAVREPNLREVDQRAFLKRLGSLLDVYTAAMKPPAEQLSGRYTIMERHSDYPAFRAFVFERRRVPVPLPRALGGRQPGWNVAGFAYGFRGVSGQWWHDVVHQALVDAGGKRHADSWLGDAFEVAELHVHPSYQGQGLGRRLLSALCAGRPEHTVVLSTLDRPDSPARRLYGSVGMTDLLREFEFPGGAQTYAIMGGPLPLAR
ncbi:GNAT family N-acetyltransferase [Actinomadura alba]|uniref:GNAT family N-acetyltransferase n=1 Tax=Actinomadura alba TaxID=406431 RepID=A0ABR7LLT3_9ACTN|nr:GNAT family N-acetyltransferase [Actinomadura alba]